MWLLWVFLLTLMFSFGVQSLTFFYYHVQGNQLIHKHKSVFHYLSGLLGDGVLLPLANVFAYLSLESLGQSLNNMAIWSLALLGGLVVTFIFHLGQQRSRSTNWTMPKVGLWNLLGVYHVIFMFAESTLLLYTLLSVVEVSPTQIWFSDFKYVLLMLGLFFGTFVYDYYHLLTNLDKNDG